MAPPEVNRGDELASIDEAMAATSTRHHGPFCESGDPQVPEPDTQVGAEAGSTMAADAPSATVAQTEGTEVNDAWTCPICLSWFDMPVAPPCRHSFCSGCLKSVVRAAVHRPHRNRVHAGPVRPACPLCRETFSPEAVVTNTEVFEDMLKATVACRNGDCSAQFCPLRWKHHQEECPAAPVQCLHQVVGCTWKGARRDLTGHVEDCAYEKIKGLIPRVSASLKQIHTQVHALEARVMAQNATVANTRAFVMSMHQRDRRSAVFPAAYALLWRPPDWRRYNCPNSDGVLANVTLVCFAPIAFLALWGGGVFGGGLELSMGQRLLYIAGVAMLACLAFLEYDNSTPWHELQRPLLLKGLRIGPTLLENTARLVVYSAIKGLRQWEQQLAILLLLAPLTYPILVQGFHRFQVKLRNAQSQAQLAQSRPLVPPRNPVRPTPVKVHGSAVNGVVRAAAMLAFGHEAILAGQVLAKLGVCVASAIMGPSALNALFDLVWVTTSADFSPEEKEQLEQVHQRNFRAMRAPFPNLRGRRARVCVAAACFCLFGALLSPFRDDVDTMVYGLLLIWLGDSIHLRCEIHVSRWVMASLQQTSGRLNHDTDRSRNPALDLLRSRMLLLWVVVGSVFLVLLMLTCNARSSS